MSLRSPSLVGFRQSDESIFVRISDAPEFVDVTVFCRVPAILFHNEVVFRNFRAEVHDGEVVISTASEPNDCEYSIVLCAGDEYVELVRQPSSWLKRLFNFDQVGGYTILGRRSIAVGAPTSAKLGPVCLVGLPTYQEMTAVECSEFSEINHSAGLVKILWATPIHIGPNSRNFMRFNSQSFDEKIRQVRSGEYSLMCQGIRDLFLHLSLANRSLAARPVDAFDYLPHFRDLISYSHAIAEVYVQTLNKWVMIDPWNGLCLTYEGKLLGAKEIAGVKNQDAIQVFPLIDRQMRVVEGSDGKNEVLVFHSSEFDIRSFLNSAYGHSPSYLTYFNNVIERGFVVVSGPISALFWQIKGVLRYVIKSSTSRLRF
jgi:hypothetical protein